MRHALELENALQLVGERERSKLCIEPLQNALTAPFKTRNFNVNNSAIRHKQNDTSPLVPSF